MERHCANAQKVAHTLSAIRGVAGVNYAAAVETSTHSIAKKTLPKARARSSTSASRAGTTWASRWVDGVRVCFEPPPISAMQGLIIHPASTTHRQLTDEQRVAAGAGPDVLRLFARERNG